MNYGRLKIRSSYDKSYNKNSNRIRDLRIDTSKYRENKAHIKKSIPLKL